MPEKKKKEKQNTTLLKKKMLEAMEQSLGVVTSACKSVGIDRSSHYRWMHEDEDYKESAENITELAIDFVESRLFKQIREGSTTGAIFYLKTKGKNRGYIETTEQRVKIDTEPPLFSLDDDESEE